MNAVPFQIHNVLSNSLEVQLSRMDLAEGIPGMKHGRLALAIYRRDVPLAKELIQGMEQVTLAK